MYDIGIKSIVNKNNFDKKIEIVITQKGHLTIVKFGDNMIHKTHNQIMQLWITIVSIIMTTIRINKQVIESTVNTSRASSTTTTIILIKNPTVKPTR